MHAAHHLRVTLSQVVIHRDNVHALALKTVEVRRQHGRQRLTLTGLHLGHRAEVQRSAAHDLHLVVLLAQHAPRRLTRRRKRIQQDVVQRRPVCQLLLKLVSLGLQLLIRKGRILLIQLHNLVSDL